MRIPFLGLEISRSKAAAPQGLNSVHSNAGYFPIIAREPFAGAWQKNKELRGRNITSFHAVYSCITLIASDVAKCRNRLVELDSNGIWEEKDSPSFSPVLRRPNRYQNRIKFYENWITSKLLHGNTYVLKERDLKGVVVAMYILDPQRVTPCVADDGSVWYRLNTDKLAGVADSVLVPASEIIHDVMVPLFHPLCGVSPLMACGLSAMQGLSIQANATDFFANGSRPSGILTAPGEIGETTAALLKNKWEENFSGTNSGKVAVLGDGLTYSAMVMNSVDAQLVEQLKMSAENVCSVFHVPAYKIGIGNMPSYDNIEALNQQYYTQCLQILFECIEALLDEGLGLEKKIDGKTYGTEFDLDDLLRMDSRTLIGVEKEAVNAGIKAPNEARKKFNLKPVVGGDSPMMQQQNYSLAALAKRDAQADPFGTSKPAAAKPANEEEPDDESIDDDEQEPETEEEKNFVQRSMIAGMLQVIPGVQI